MIRTAVLGASGYVGGELIRLLTGHPDLTVTRVFGDSRAGEALADVHPHVAASTQGLGLERFAPSMLDEVDLVLSAMPHGKSQVVASEILDRGIPLVDLGADFRLSSAAEYERWYGEPHSAPERLSAFTYGLPELYRDSIRSSKAVAAAGCYATAAILALKPLIQFGLVSPSGIIVDAASGVSGAGRVLKEATAFNTVDGSFSAYGLLNHRHTAEMEMSLGASLLFTPHLAPMSRGILATCYAEAARELAEGEPLAALRGAYSDEPFVHVSERLPATKYVAGSNAAHLTARFDPRTGRVLAIAAIDNLGKGAAGQMIQCVNLMLGLEETAGLSQCGVFP